MWKKKKKRKIRLVSISMIVLSVLFFLSACGKKEEPAEETGWFSELNKIATEIVIENNIAYVGSLIVDKKVELAIHKIHYGSFSDEALRHQESADEIFLECRLLDIPAYAGLDTRVGILLDADSLEMIAYKDFAGDEVMLRCLQTANGQSRILCLRTAFRQGHRTPYFELWAVQGGEWVEIPTGIEELIPEEKKGDWGTEDCFCYMTGGDRLVVTYEEDAQIMFERGHRVPSELAVVLVWDPNKEKFVLDTNTEQPVMQQEPAEEETWLTKLERLAVETVIENSELNGGMVERGELEVAIDKIHSGSFSDEALRHQENANEIFLDCKLLHMPHIGGLDTRAGILLDADTMDLIAYKEFAGDHVMLYCLQTAKGQNRILFLSESGGQGYRGQWFELWGVRDGEWEELPTGIEELIPEEHKEITTGVNGTEIRTGDSFCYMAGGGRLVVTYEEDIAFGVRVPSELSLILVWNPFQERFELPTNVEQPAIQQD